MIHPQPRRLQRYSDWERSIVGLAVEAGYSSRQIARMLGRSQMSVERHRKWVRAKSTPGAGPVGRELLDLDQGPD